MVKKAIDAEEFFDIHDMVLEVMKEKDMKKAEVDIKLLVRYSKMVPDIFKKIYVKDFDFVYCDADDGKIYFIPKVTFSAPESLPYNFSVNEEEVFKKAEELGIAKELVHVNHPKYNFSIRDNIVRIIGYEKVKNDQKIFNNVMEVILNRAKELKNLIEGRSKAKLEEVS